jgi:hypothetical protein
VEPIPHFGQGRGRAEVLASPAAPADSPTATVVLCHHAGRFIDRRATCSIRFLLTNIHIEKNTLMNNMFRGLFAGAAAYKWGGGCFGTILIFVIVYMLLGHC